MPDDLDATLWPRTLTRLLRNDDLDDATIDAVMSTILSGDATDAQIAGFALALRAKGETAAELASLVRTMMRFARRVELPPATGPYPAVDIVGTGGDRARTVNISTLAAIVVAAAGVPVAKHGNRAASSACGSADLLEELGVAIALPPEGVARCVADAGIGFCFAPAFHPAMRFTGPVRRELGIPTVFNFLGPLANPAGVRHQAVGVFDAQMAERLVAVLGRLGLERALVFHGHDGLDELTTTDVSFVQELRDGEVRRYVLDPAELGLPRAAPEDLRGGDAACNAAIARRMLEGDPGPIRDVVLLNAAAGLLVAGAERDLHAGLERAAAAVDDGRASATLERFVKVSRAVADSGGGG